MPNVSLPEAPALNLSNPAVGAAGEGASAASHAYAAGLQFASALKNQARMGQQQQAQADHQAQQDQQKQANEYAIETGKLREMGGVALPQYDTATAIQNSGQSDRPTLKRPADPNNTAAAPADPSHIQIDSQGHAWHVPTLEEREAAKQKPQDDTNSFIPTGKLAKDLEAAGVKPGTRLPLAEALKQEDAKPSYVTGQDADGNEALLTPDPKTGKLSPVEFPDGYSAGKPAADKPSKFTYGQHTDDAGRVSATRSGDEGAQIWKGGRWIPMGDTAAIGPKRKDPDATGGQKPATPAQLNSVQLRMKTSLARAEAAYKKEAAAASVGGYTDTDKAAQALENLHQAKQSAQDTYEQELSQYGYPVQHTEYSPETQTAPGPAGPAGKSAPAAPPPAQQQQPPAAAPPAAKPTAPPTTSTTSTTSTAPPAAKPPLGAWDRLAKPAGPAAPAKAAAPAVAPKYTEGQTKYNPKTGAKAVFRGGKWQITK